MGHGFKHGASGAPLNFKVVGGTTEPTNPKEVLLWVDTDQKITSWTFSATEPETKAEGDVWFATGTESPVEFNALKKNDVRVYPKAAKQYIGAEWVDKPLKIYQDGAWGVPDFVLYDRGTNNVTFTTSGNGSLSEASDHLTFKATADAYSTFDAAVDRTFDLTLYKTMTFDYQTINNNSVFAAMVMDGDTIVARANASSKATTFGTATVDISELKGEYKLKFRHYSEGAARTVYVYNWKLLAI